MEVTITVNAVDVSSRLFGANDPVGGPLQIDWKLGAEIDVAQFSLADFDNTLDITSMQVVEITQTDVTPSKKIFGGLIAKPVTQEVGVGRIWNCTAYDWTWLLHRTSVDQDFENQFDDQIITAAFATAGITEINSTTKVERLRLFNTLRFTGQPLYQVITLLAEASSATWHINPDKELVYKLPATDLAPFNFSDQYDDVTTFPYRRFIYNRDGSSIYNQVRVRGGNELSSDQAIIIATDGTATIYAAENLDGHVVTSPPSDADTAFTPQGVVRVEVFLNTGSDGTPTWTQKGVGLEGEDVLGTAFDGKTVDVLWNALTHRLTFNTAPPVFANNGIQVRGRYHIPIQVTLKNQAAITATAGRVFHKDLTDPSIVTQDMAIDVGRAFLNQHAIAVLRASLIQDKDELEVGQLVSVVNAIHSVNATFVIHQIRMTYRGGSMGQYQVVIARGSPSDTLEKILQELHAATRNQNPLDEARTDVEDVTDDTLTITDATPVFREVGPRYYVASVDGPAYDLFAFQALTQAISLTQDFMLGESADWPLSMLLDVPEGFYLDRVNGGTDTEVIAPSDTSFDNVWNAGGTLSCQFMLTEAVASQDYYLAYKLWRLHVTDQVLTFQLGYGAGGQRVWEVDRQIQLNTPYIFVMTLDADPRGSSSVRIWLNKVEQSVTLTAAAGGGGDTPNDDSAQPLRVGNSQFSGGEVMKGFCHKFQFYGSILSDTVIEGFGPEYFTASEVIGALVAYLGHETGTTWDDLSPNVLDATVSGTRQYLTAKKGATTALTVGMGRVE